jgi:Protein of unknown function (DUF3306)
MSEPENFLARWSRRKRAAAEPAEEPAPKDAAVEKMEQPAGEKILSEQASRAAELPAFDISSLPAIDSIVAGTDIRPFLAPGVPTELTRAALRRAWTTDPGIRDFIGLSENAWDFTKAGPTGFGPLLPIDDVKKLLAEIFSGREEESAPREPQRDSAVVAAVDSRTPEPQSRDLERKIERPPSLQSNTNDQQVMDENPPKNAAMQNESETNDTPKRSHGGALPE